MPTVPEIIKSACNHLYREQKDLIDTRSHERTIAAYLAEYLRPHFPGLQVDSDPNRMGNKGEAKRARDGRRLVPDLIVHKRGSIEGPNLAVIQIKGFLRRIGKRTRKTSTIYGRRLGTNTFIPLS